MQDTPNKYRTQAFVRSPTDSLDGERVRSVFLVEDTEMAAKLRLLLVTPAARGKGVGKRLVDECIAFARHANYQKLILWTNSVLDSARHIYEADGFRLVSEEEHTSFGHHLTGQYWELDLGDARRLPSD